MIRTPIFALFSTRVYVLNGLARRTCSSLSKVKVLCTDDDEFLKISFRYGNLPPAMNLISIKAMKNQEIGQALTHIKFVVNLQRKKESLRRVVSSRYSDSSFAEAQEVSEDDLEINLINRDKHVVSDVKNVDAWTQGSILKIGDQKYEVNYNTPTVITLALPEFILPGCVIRPHFLFECANAADSSFSWYRSVGIEQNEELSSKVEWEKVSEGMLYTTSCEDIGHRLKVECIPRMQTISGPMAFVVTNNVVEAGPIAFPFEERHMYTKDLVDSDCIRCMSYNILANCYVESRRFPYASKKARNIYYRKQLLIKEILGYNCDVICLQEVQDRIFQYDLLPVMKKVGFDGFYVRKGGKRYEGVAVFYRSAKFNVVSQYGVYLNEIVKEKDIFNQVVKKVSGNYKDMSKLLAQDTALSVVMLEHTDNPNHRVIIANTHLYSNKDKPEVRLIQSALCSSYLERFLDSVKSGHPHPDNIGLIFCGDFNSLPNSAAYDFLLNGSYCSPGRQSKSAAEDQDTTLRHNLAIKSACGAPEYTNYTEEFFGCLDYIFYRDNELFVSEVVPMPKHEDVIKHIALPSELFPSDHIPLLCTFKWKKWLNKC